MSSSELKGQKGEYRFRRRCAWIALSVVLFVAQVPDKGAAGILVDDRLIAGPPENRRINWVQTSKDDKGNVYVTWGNRIYNGKDASHYQRFDIFGNRNSPHIEIGGLDDSVATISSSQIAVDRRGRVALGWTYFFPPTHPDPRFGGFLRLLDSTWQPLTDSIRYTQHPNDVSPYGIEFDSSGKFTVLTDMSTLNILHNRDTLGEPIGNGDSVPIVTPWIWDEDPIPCWSGDSLYVCGGAGNSRMARLENGDLAVAWWGGAFIGTPIQTGYPSFRIFSPNLVPQDTPRVFSCDGYPCVVSDSLLGYGAHPFVSALPNSNFVLTYYQGYDYPNSYLPYARVYRSDGTAITPAFNAADAYPDYTYFKVKSAAADDGTFVVIWSDLRFYDHGLDLFAQRFDTLGNPIGVNHIINNVRGSLGGNDELYDAEIVDSFLVIAWVDFRDYPAYEGLVYMQTMTLSSIGRVVSGDVDVNDSINAADIIHTVNYVFKSGEYPQPQPLAADVTGECIVTSADIIHLVNYVFKAGAAPVNSGCLTGPL